VPTEDTLILRMRAVGAIGTAREVAAVKDEVAATAAATDKATAASARQSRGLKQLNRNTLGVGRAFRDAGTSLTRLFTVPLVGVGTAATVMSIKFSQALTEISAQTGYTTRQVALLRPQVLALAKTTPFGPEELAKGLYHVASLGTPARRAMELLSAATKGAIVGSADLESTVSALGGVIRTNIKGSGNYQKTMAILNATVGAGNLRLSDLNEALGTGAVASFKTAGLSLQDFTGALALFTDENYPASSAAAQMATALHYLYAPSTKGKKALDYIGLSADKLGRQFDKPRGLLKALTLLKSHLDKLGDPQMRRRVLAALLPGGRGRIMLTLLNQLGQYDRKMDQIDNTTNRFGRSLREQQLTPLNQLKTAWSSVQTSLIELGDTLVPRIVPILKGLGNIISGIAHAFVRLPKPVQTTILVLSGLLAVLGPLLTMVGFFIIAFAALDVLASPWLAIAAAVAVLVLGLGYLYAKFEVVRNLFKTAFDVWLALNPFYYMAKGVIWLVKQLAKLSKALHIDWGVIGRGLLSAVKWVVDKINILINVWNSLPFVHHISPIDLSPHHKPTPIPAGAPTTGVTTTGGISQYGPQGFSRRGDPHRRRIAPPASGGIDQFGPQGFARSSTEVININVDGKQVAKVVRKRNKQSKASR
jgi:TP901 family phage tail tape measure protein